MTPKDKVKELYDKLYAIELTAYYYGCEEQIPYHAIKECLNIFVDEILQITSKHYDDSAGYEYKYWKEVRNEIEKL